MIEKICREIKTSGANLEKLASQFNLSPSYLQKKFKSAVGLSPKQYELALRRQKLDQCLTQSITQAAYASGYANHFYDQEHCGMKALDYKNSGRGQTVFYSNATCSLGPILVAHSERGVCAILLGDQNLAQLKKKFSKAQILPSPVESHNIIDYVVSYIDQQKITFSLPLDIVGTVYQKKVWSTLMQIPRGKTLTYKEVTTLIGDTKASRAVANACAANSLAVVVPCHRVLGSGGNLCGYRWGAEKKKKLLDQERAMPE